MPIISDAIKYSRFAFGLRDFLRGTISLEQSKEVIATLVEGILISLSFPVTARCEAAALLRSLPSARKYGHGRSDAGLF
jgi:hypothetical protein